MPNLQRYIPYHPHQDRSINTCGFINPAKEEGINTILEMAEYKNGHCKKLIVLGCLAQRYKQDLIDEIPEINCKDITD